MKAQSRYIAGAPRTVTNRKTGAPKKLTARESARAALKYMQYRAKGEHENQESRDLFTSDHDTISRQDALDLLLSHSHPRVAFQQLILPWAEDEPVENPREAIRAIMAGWDAAHGYKSQWTAVIHRNTDHLHAHLLLAGKAQDTTTGKSRLVTIHGEQGDYDLLNQLGRQQSQVKEREQERAILAHVEREAEERREQHAAARAQQQPQAEQGYRASRTSAKETTAAAILHLGGRNRAAVPSERAASSAALLRTQSAGEEQPFHTPPAQPIRSAPHAGRSRERSV
jgi:hypothetical protein